MPSNQIKKLFFEDDGTIPNSKFPVLIYHNAFEDRNEAGAAWLEDTFGDNNWKNGWRDGVFPYHHYHSTTHEAMGVYSGKASLQLGGGDGQKVEVQAGDVVVLPAGVGHKKLDSSSDFAVAAAYPNGRNYDINTGKDGERPQVDRNIEAVPMPDADPLLGENAGLRKTWREIKNS
jgi:uncharacterized protein YjlB